MSGFGIEEVVDFGEDGGGYGEGDGRRQGEFAFGVTFGFGYAHIVFSCPEKVEQNP